MTKHSVSKHKSHKVTRHIPRWSLFVVGTVIVVIGLILTVFLHAAPAKLEAEAGTLSSAATQLSDTSSSGGQAVQFGTTPPPSGGGGARSCPPLPAYPDANCTGVLPGVARTPMASTTISQDGTVLQNIDFTGRLTVTANNVVIKNMKLTTNDYYGLMIYGNNLTVTDSTFISTSPDTQSVLSSVGGTFNATRVDISGGPDGIQMGSNSSLTDSYIHDLNPCNGCHNDTVNADDVINTTMIHNTLLNQIGQTSVITAPNASILIKDNWLAGGGYTIYGGHAASPSGGIVITNNVFSRQYFPNVGFWGPAAYWYNESGNSWTNNKYDDGTTVPSP